MVSLSERLRLYHALERRRTSSIPADCPSEGHADEFGHMSPITTIAVIVTFVDVFWSFWLSIFRRSRISESIYYSRKKERD